MDKRNKIVSNYNKPSKLSIPAKRSMNNECN